MRWYGRNVWFAEWLAGSKRTAAQTLRVATFASIPTADVQIDRPIHRLGWAVPSMQE
jgi:hypothetical protein